MWDRYLVSRLSPKGAQVLLSLLLTRQTETQNSSAEFAKLTGLGQRSIAPALLELESVGLIQIIAQPGKPPKVRLVHPEEVYEATVTEVGPEHIGTAETLALALPAAGVEVAGGETGTESIPGVAPDRLIETCRLADESQDKGLRVAALQDVWDFAFPYKDYPLQRLTNDAAGRLLVNRSAEWVAGVILDAVEHAQSKITSPRGYIEVAVANAGRRDALKKSGMYQAGQVTVTDELRRLAQLGKEQFGAQGQDGTADK